MGYKCEKMYVANSLKLYYNYAKIYFLPTLFEYITKLSHVLCIFR